MSIAIDPTVRAWLRAEGLAVLAVSVLLYAHIAASWWLFALLLPTPDLSMLPYLLNPRVGALSYNVAHNYVFPFSLAAIAPILHFEWLLPYMLIWTAHIGMDPMLGYGLKYPAAFGITHLRTLNNRAVKP